MKPIDPLVEDDDDIDEQNGLIDEKMPREIGLFIKHEDFNTENLGDGEELKDFQNLSSTEQVFVMDHDFVCISKQSDDEFTQLYMKGLEGYLGTDWIGAQMAF